MPFTLNIILPVKQDEETQSRALQFKARFAGPGMRWSRAGAENLLPIRTAILSSRFDQCWSLSYNSPPN